MTIKEAEDFRAQMERLKRAFDSGFWTGSEVQHSIHLLADTVVGFNSRLAAIEAKL